LSAAVDLAEVWQRQLRSFRRFEHAIDQLITAAREQKHICTPPGLSGPPHEVWCIAGRFDKVTKRPVGGESGEPGSCFSDGQ
jgi:hypothetical protein